MASRTRTSPAAQRARPAARRPKSGAKRKLKIAFIVLGLLGLWGAIGGGLWWNRAMIAAEAKLPELERAELALQSDPSEILSADGVVLFKLMRRHRDWVPINQIPRHVLNATVAAEDKRFWSHQGVDPVGVIRAAFVNVREARFSQGFSTIPMQIAKNTFSQSERTFNRKMQDVVLATMIENRRTKDQILEIYLNQMYYGAGAYGVAAAADVFFGKSVEQLTLSEAALLARCVRRPSDQNPFASLSRAVENRNVVLKIMLDEKWITQQEYEAAKAEQIKLAPRRNLTGGSPKRAPHFVDYVLNQLHEVAPDINVWDGGYKVVTTLNMEMQKVAEEEVRKRVAALARAKVRNGAFLLVDDTGRIKAMVGGTDYNKSQFNIVTQGKRQPGSAFKPFVYAAAFSDGVLSPNGSISNARVSYPMGGGKTWSPRNSSGGYGGMVSVRTAVSQSLNVPAVRTLEQLGASRLVTVCKRQFGFTSELDPYLSLALGSSAVSPLEMARGYSVFMLHGDRVEPYGVSRIVGPDGAELVRVDSAVTRSVFDRDAAAATDALLRTVVTSGTGRAASGVLNARGKTGTTNSFADAWFVGYSDRLVGVGWVGNDQAVTRQGRVYGGEQVAPMWAAILKPSQRIIGEDKRDVPTSVSGGSAALGQANDEPAAGEAIPTDEETVTSEPLDEPAPPSDEPRNDDPASDPDAIFVETP